MLFNKNKCTCRTCISYRSHGQDTTALQTDITRSILSLPICVNHFAKTILKRLHPSKVWWKNLHPRNPIEFSHKCSFCSKQWGCWLRFISRSSYMRIRWLDNITNSTDMNLSKLRETVKDRRAWRPAVRGVAKSWA